MTHCTDTVRKHEQLIIFNNLPLTCSGYVEKYHFRPINYGTVFVGIFRPMYNTTDQWQLIGFNKIVVEESMRLGGAWHNVTIPADEQINVLAGDSIGLFSHADQSDQVIGHKRSSGRSKIFRSSHTFEDMHIDGIYGGVSNLREREFGLNAVIAHNRNRICESPVHPIQQLGRDSSGHLNIFADLTFNCEGYVEVIDFYASKVGKFYLSAWRKVDGNNKKWTLVGSTAIEATSVGAHLNHTIDRDEQIYVKAEDVLGIFYDKRAVGVVPYENHHKSTLDIEHSSKVHVSQTYSDDLAEGSEISGLLNDGMNRRVPALNARIFAREEVPSVCSEEAQGNSESAVAITPPENTLLERHDGLTAYTPCSGPAVLRPCATDDKEKNSYERRIQSRRIKQKRTPLSGNSEDFADVCVTGVEVRQCEVCVEVAPNSECAVFRFGQCLQYKKPPRAVLNYCNDLGYGTFNFDFPLRDVEEFPCEDYDNVTN